MNEEANFCSQCGEKISSGVKFCSNCGYDLQKRSSKTSLDANIKLETANVKLETTNATLEKGFKSVEKGVKATGSSIKKTIKLIVKILILGAILYGVFFIGFMLRESYLKNDRDKALQDLKLKIETAQAKPSADSEWKVSGSEDPASGENIGRKAFNWSKDDLCSMSVEHSIDGVRLTNFLCQFIFVLGHDVKIKFDNDQNVHTMDLNYNDNSEYFSAYVEPIIPVNYTGNIRPCDLSGVCVEPNRLLSYRNFINGLISAKTVAIKLTPTINHGYYHFYNYATGTTLSWSERLNLGPIWFSFSLKGAREAIAKLGKELETAPNISND